MAPAAVEAKGSFLVLDPDLRIVDASDAYLRTTLVWREEIRGRALFDVFPDNPDDRAADGARNLKASLQQVLATRAPHRMEIQRYDVRDFVAGNGRWIEKHWAPANTPVFGGDSTEITHVIHSVTDVTHAVQMARRIDEELQFVDQHSTKLDHVRQNLLAQREALLAARRVVDAMLLGAPAGGGSARLTHLIGLGDTDQYLAPGATAPLPGVYRAFHMYVCPYGAARVYVAAGRAFPRCQRCGDAVLYRLVRAMNA